MADLNRADVKIQVRISDGNFNDALYYSPTEFEGLTDEDIDAIKTARVSKWLEHVQVESAKENPLPTKAELEQQKEALVADIAAIDEKLLDIAK